MGWCSERWCLPSQVTTRSEAAWLSWSWLNIHLPAHGKEWIHSLLCFAGIHSFSCTHDTAFTSPGEFPLTCTLLHLCPTPPGQSESVAAPQHPPVDTMLWRQSRSGQQWPTSSTINNTLEHSGTFGHWLAGPATCLTPPTDPGFPFHTPH